MKAFIVIGYALHSEIAHQQLVSEYQSLQNTIEQLVNSMDRNNVQDWQKSDYLNLRHQQIAVEKEIETLQKTKSN